MNEKRYFKGKLYVNNNERLAIDSPYGEYEFHCGYCIELFLCNKWLSTRIEADYNGNYYAVGLRGLKLEGLSARVQVSR